MTTIMSQSDLARKAIAWISEMLNEHPGKATHVLIEEAGVRFNLGPKDEEFLQRFYKDKQDQTCR